MISTFHHLHDQLRLAFRQAAVYFMRAVVPTKGVDHFMRYFSTCAKLTVEREASAVFQFNLYLLLLAYLALLQLAFTLLPLSPLARLALVDGIFIQQISGQYYLLYIGTICYSAILHWQAYGRCNHKLNALVEWALTGRTALHQGYRRKVVKITNGMQSFILYLDFCLIIFLGAFAFKVLTSDSVVLLMVLFPVSLFHLMLFFLLWVSFVHTMCLMATFGFISQMYVFTFFRQNYVKLDQALKLTIVHCRYILLKRALQRNLRLFEEFFLFDAFFGPFLTVYLAIHLPSSAYFATVIAFGQVKGPMLVTLIGCLIENINGSLFAHLIAANLSNFVLKSGKLLLTFIAHNSINKSNFPIRVKLTLYSHIQQLVVQKRKYGITYNGW